ncbi:uncharacterized protein LOC116265465 isoform X4 [Nymphaea colorata]|nr:uncharacterized protein LOC116265465 isoform X1 [Nymphaea colorata]XP_049936757.1 uncharacterized protein LOC116265465 isoform X2 [Nymphaea colorata]XP_049936758.1 uncharacterized protein LOC116265465 isoform X3 [Nymphaea colorata]XP_049936759.1 uncharacterized protein LOC116265465 isoform X4 [Nymphaea colorata]
MASIQGGEREGHSFKSLLALRPTYDEQWQVPTAKEQDKETSEKKRALLENEVAKLQKMVEQEESLHQVLQRAFHRQIGSLPYLPDFVPKEMKELLMEVAMVEDNIAQLEGEVNDLQRGLTQERDLYNGLYYRHQLQQQQFKQQQQEEQQQKQISEIRKGSDNTALSYRVSSLFDERPKTQATRRRRHASMGSASEAEALFSINHTVRSGDLASSFSTKELPGGRLKSATFGKEAGFNQNSSSIKSHENGSHGKGTKRSTTEKIALAPKLPPKHPTAKTTEKEMKGNSNLVQKPSTTLTVSQDNVCTTLPNKLSEDIIKCLICIFLRMLRTSRMVKPDKSLNYAKTALSPLPSFLKIENFSSLKEPSLDPYGIFDIDESIPRDIGPYKNFVILTTSSFNTINLDSCRTLLEQLRILLSKLCKVELRFLTYKQKLAFWINMYNACIMHAYLQHGVQPNLENLLLLIKKVELNIGGSMLNAFEIEHLILGQPIEPGNKEAYLEAKSNMKDDIVHYKHKLEHREPNVTFALSCGSRSSPAVRIYTAQAVSMELERSKLEYLQASIVVTSTKKLMIPKLLQQYMRDCSTNIDLLIDWVCSQLPLSCSLRKSIIECIRGHKNEPISTFAEVIPYQSEFLYLLVT